MAYKEIKAIPKFEVIGLVIKVVGGQA